MTNSPSLAHTVLMMMMMMRKKGSLILLKIGSVVVQDKLNFAIYENSGLFFEKFEKIQISSWKLGKLWWNFGSFGSKIPTWRGHFFCSPETWHTCRAWKVKYRNFRVLWFCKKKSEKNSIKFLKFWKIFCFPRFRWKLAQL